MQPVQGKSRNGQYGGDVKAKANDLKKVFPNQIEHTHKHPQSSLIQYATENEHESYKPLFNPPHKTQAKKRKQN